MNKNSEKKFTKKQHYIPQVYLRGFSPEYLHRKTNNIPRDKYTIYCYDIPVLNPQVKAIPIKSVCFQEKLYEVYDEDGEIILPNYLEKALSELEIMFGKYRSSLENKAFHRENYHTKCFLTNNEEAFWVTFLIAQLLRNPNVLAAAEEISNELLGNSISNVQVKNLARSICLPFFKELEEDDEDSIVYRIFKPMQKMHIGIGVDIKGRIITSDKSVYIKGDPSLSKELDEIIFPITSQICLIMFGNENKKDKDKNFLFPIDGDLLKYINISIAAASYKKIYLNHSLSKQERAYLDGFAVENNGNA